MNKHKKLFTSLAALALTFLATAGPTRAGIVSVTLDFGNITNLNSSGAGSLGAYLGTALVGTGITMTESGAALGGPNGTGPFTKDNFLGSFLTSTSVLNGTGDSSFSLSFSGTTVVGVAMDFVAMNHDKTALTFNLYNPASLGNPTQNLLFTNTSDSNPPQDGTDLGGYHNYYYSGGSLGYTNLSPNYVSGSGDNGAFHTSGYVAITNQNLYIDWHTITSIDNLTLYYNNNTSQTAPEPGTLALLGIGLATLGSYGWRRRKRMVAA